jgi:flagellar basal-body rod protein FlgC
MSDITATIAVAASGMRAQTVRMRVAAENVANANSTGMTPGADPYRRRTPLFETAKIPETEARGVRVLGARNDDSAFRLQFNPTHPAADENGMVKLPNVDSLVEMMDMREAARAYEANLSMIDTARQMSARALDLLRR